MHIALSRIIGRAMAVTLLTAGMSVPGTHIGNAEALLVPTDGYGFSVGGPMTWMSDVDADRELDAAARAGATWIRVLISWDRVEPMPGAFDWGYVDHWINGTRARGMKVLGVIAYTPDWARLPGSDFTAPPADPALFASFASTVAQRYGDRVSNWEIWNEPNVPYFFGYLEDRAAPYTDLLKAAYPAIKSVQPHSTVVVAGMSRADGPDAPPVFINEMYALGAKGSFDALAMHPYVTPTGLPADELNGWSDVERVRQIMVDNGDADKKIWMTEFGAPTSEPSAGGVSQEEQAKQITDVLARAATSGFSGPAFIYSIRDENTAIRDNDYYNWGALLTSDWQPKFTSNVLRKRS
jgi:hypothetical protein